tara:strand:- start:1334 stop:2065 length:732 start_codon:yes stop_codon:yes gene_type:complete
MTKIIIVDKNKNKKETKLREFSLTELYKKANLKNSKNFIKQHTWKVSDKFVSLFATNSGRANNENGYELPPPIDSELFFGKIIMVKHFNEEINDDNVEDLTLEEWEKIYEKLFGGFEDLGEEDSFSDEEIIPEKYKTKEGYSKEDGFIVDSGEEDSDFVPDEEYESNDEIIELEDNELEDNELENEETTSKVESEENVEDPLPELESDEEFEEVSEYESDDGLNDMGSELSEESYISDSDEEP